MLTLQGAGFKSKAKPAGDSRLADAGYSMLVAQLYHGDYISKESLACLVVTMYSSWSF